MMFGIISQPVDFTNFTTGFGDKQKEVYKNLLKSSGVFLYIEKANILIWRFTIHLKWLKMD